MSLTIREYIRFVAPDLIEGNDGQIQCPEWPGDVFAICYSILDRANALSGFGINYFREDEHKRSTRIAQTIALAVRWRLSTGRREKLQEINQLWDAAVVDSADVEIAGLGREFDGQGDRAQAEIARNSVEHLVHLCTIADEAFAGVGIHPARSHPVLDPDDALDADQQAEQDFWRYCDNLLNESVAFDSSAMPLGATLCWQISPNKLRVLPKAQPPLNGLSTRSLTTYISLCPAVDMPVNWYAFPQAATNRKCNLLLVPWPFVVNPSQFVDCGIDSGNPKVGWFGYQPDGDWHAPVNKVKELLEKATKGVGSVDLVVLPETSVTREQYNELEAYLTSRGVLLIAGVCEPGKLKHQDEIGRLGRNYAAVSYAVPNMPDYGNLAYLQHKHHRWRINSSQIETYSIATQLDPQKNWWEGICTNDRSLNFFVFRDWLCSCVLICEDLARLDPAGQFVRAVAPDLVIALLFDGPQIPTRWPAYHATVLADDPGSSVLTLSCLGMTQLSRPRSSIENTAASRTVGMWRDPRKGHVPIQLPPDKQAALLTITRCRATGVTADGRSNSQLEGGPEYAGLFYI